MMTGVINVLRADVYREKRWNKFIENSKFEMSSEKESWFFMSSYVLN